MTNSDIRKFRNQAARARRLGDGVNDTVLNDALNRYADACEAYADALEAADVRNRRPANGLGPDDDG